MHIKNMWKHSQFLIAASYLQFAIEWDKFNFRRFFPTSKFLCPEETIIQQEKQKSPKNRKNKPSWNTETSLSSSILSREKWKNNNNITTQI